MATQAKTSISFLQEIAVKRSLTLAYELISSKCFVQDPVYVMKCTAGKFSATASGSSKKKAKHNVAAAVLMKILIHAVNNSQLEANEYFIRDFQSTNVNFVGFKDMVDSIVYCPENCQEFEAFEDFLETFKRFSLESGCASMTGSSSAGMRTVCGGGGGGGNSACDLGVDDFNHVGRLQELCQRKVWPQPIYSFTMLRSPNEYQCELKLWKWEIRAIGTSKKLAKRQAASEMFDLITKQNLFIPEEALESLEEDSLNLNREKNMQLVAAAASNAAAMTSSAAASNASAVSDCAPSAAVNAALAAAIARTQLEASTELANKFVNRYLRGVWNKKGKRITRFNLKLSQPSSSSTTSLASSSALSANQNWCELLQSYCEKNGVQPSFAFSRTSASKQLRIQFKKDDDGDGDDATSQVICLLELDTNPSIVQIGYGESDEIAQNEAAFNTLHYLAMTVPSDCNFESAELPVMMNARREIPT